MLTVQHYKTFWCSLSRCRASKFLLESSEVTHWRSVQLFPGLLADDKQNGAAESSIERNTSQISVDDGSRTDFNKYRKDKISSPRSNTDRVASPITFAAHFKNKFISSQDAEVNFLDKIMITLPKKCHQRKYFDMIVNFLNERRLSEALDVLQVTMLKEDCVKPEYYIYTILIKYCGLVGYPDMAFKLYADMIQQGLFVEQTVYLNLFLSVANCPSPIGLKAIRDLLAFMNENGIELKTKTCWAILRAFGQCGSVEDGIKVLDYMEAREMYVPAPVISYLFRACITDKSTGFRNVVLLYKQMVKNKVQLGIYQFNNLLHCTRDCSIGDVDAFISVLKRFGLENYDKLSSEKKNISTETGYQYTQFPRRPPNILSDPPTLGYLNSLRNIKTPQDRLNLLGGAEAVINEMAKHNVEPDLSACSYLLLCGPNSIAAEKYLLQISEQLNISLNVRFLNDISRRRIRRKEYTEAKELLSLIKNRGLEPDKYTFEILSLTCKEISDANELLKQMNEYGIRPSVIVVHCFLVNAYRNYQMEYVNMVLDIIDSEEMEVDHRLHMTLETFFKKCMRISMAQPNSFPPEKMNGIQEFCEKYPEWRSTVWTKDVQ